MIRHMRPEAAANKSVASIPAPNIQALIVQSEALLAKPSMPEARNDLASRLCNPGDQEGQLKLWTRLAQVLPEPAVVSALETLTTYPSSWRVRKSVCAALRTWRTGNPDSVMRQVAFAEVEHHFEHRTETQLSNIGVHALSHVMPERNWDEEPTDEQLSQAVAVGHAVAALMVHDERDSAEAYASAPAWAIIEENPELMTEVMVNHERALEIAQFIKERGRDIELIKEFLRLDRTPLNEGIL